MKTLQEINEKIRKGKAVVVRADEMPDIVESDGAERAAREVDVVTTGTFGAMCSSGVFLNFGHSDPPIKMTKVWLNEVEAYTGLAAVDAYVGATELSLDRGFDYGGAHVIEDLVSGMEVKLKATAYGTDCYPRRNIETMLTLDDLNQAIMFNPRNAYQRYNAATNSTRKVMYTYMGTLLPNMRNINFSGTGEISPLNNDPEYEVVGAGTKIFLCGTQGFVVSEGTQHSPTTKFATLSVTGNLKGMSLDYLKAATIPRYGTTLYVGIGIPIPILNEDIAKNTAVRNKDLKTNILDYGVQRLKRPVLREVSYEELFSGKVEINDRLVKSSCLSSMKVSRRIMKELKEWIEDGEFLLTERVNPLPKDTIFKPMKMRSKTPLVGEIMTKTVYTAYPEDSIVDISSLLVKKNIDQAPVVDDENKVVGIVTAWDITKATATRKSKVKDIMTTGVITSKADEPLDVVSRRLDSYGINSTPVVDDENRLIGIVTLSDINRFYQSKSK